MIAAFSYRAEMHRTSQPLGGVEALTCNFFNSRDVAFHIGHIEGCLHSNNISAKAKARESALVKNSADSGEFLSAR